MISKYFIVTILLYYFQHEYIKYHINKMLFKEKFDKQNYEQGHRSSSNF